ncbi:LysR family transcriptional regulator [Algihabitans albus]|uniref:LysR substrate-binding domain-containing protein n=1 Tax=Algihabitans albus TaxID=2164067 RepID=UPI000E5CA7DB|nr:LysR family transcriptional regulator [Algihabitans albus]
MSALDHRVLRQFLAVAEQGTVRAAARALNMSQPPLTAAIRQLEERLGLQLFARSVAGMTLTDAGQALADEAAAILGRLERTEALLLEVAGRPKPLRIGFVSAALNGALPALLRSLKAQSRPAPKLHEMTTPQQLDALKHGKIDVGLLHPPIPALSDFDSRSLGRDPFWAALPADHRLARRRSLRFAEITREPFILFPESQGPVLYDKIRTLVHGTGRDFQIAAETERLHSQMALVAGGLGVGLITRLTAANLTIQGVKAIPLKDTQDRLFTELWLTADSGRTPELLEMVCHHLHRRRSKL